MNTHPASLLADGRNIRDQQRFAFGENWWRFLAVLDSDRIEVAEDSLRQLLALDDLHGKTFVDVGSGSGLFSLAARRMGAKVHSFDFDAQSVACTRELKRRYFSDDEHWQIDEGSILDANYLDRLGRFDIVYSWGVLHHTGDMWQALRNVDHLVGDRGQLAIALYNDQGTASRIWRTIKRLYVALPRALRFLLVGLCYMRLWGPTTVKDFLRLRPFATWRARKLTRGMSPHRDVIDWVGGYPFEVCKPEQVFDHFRLLGYHLTKLKTCSGGRGCNEFAFRRGS